MYVICPMGLVSCYLDIDELLTNYTVVTPVEAPNMEIDIASDDDDEFRPMRVSSKGMFNT